MPRRKKEDEIALADRKGPPRGAANARERTRMRVLSKAFGRLKLTLPWVPPDTKLSKLDTLRLATSYISHLQVTFPIVKIMEFVRSFLGLFPQIGLLPYRDHERLFLGVFLTFRH